MPRQLTARPRGRRVAVHHARKSRRWPKRLVIGSASVLVLLVLLAAAVYVYARYTYDKLHKTTVTGLASEVPGKPFDILLVGSDTRAFVSNAAQAAAYGSKQTQTGQRSDVIIVARVVPATHQVRLLSIPRDTWVDVAGNIPGVSGPNRINAAYDSGPSLLVQTIWSTFHIPVSYYVGLDFPAFEGMVNALGGIYLDFRYPARDAYSGLDVTQTGCQLVNGTTALSLVRSRHYYYYANGAWQYDGLSDLSRIQRQDAFFRAVLERVHSSISLTSLTTLDSFVNAASSGLTIDSTLSEGEILSLARMFRGVSLAALQTETLPTSPEVMSGQDVLVPVVGPDQHVLDQFLSFGESPSGSAGPTGQAASTSSPSAMRAARPDAPGAAAPAATLDSVRLSLLGSASPAIPPAGGSATVNTVPGTPAITDPAQIDYNNQPEPWNPTVCTPS